MLSDEFLHEVAMKNDIVDLISSYTSLKRTGRNFVGLCPFHAEKTPSFYVYQDSQSFYCFGCGVGGDIITFVKLIENLDFMESVKFLASRVGMQVPETDYNSSLSRKKNRIYEANRAAAKFFHKSLYSKDGQFGLAYLRHRALSEYTIKHFGLGFSPSSRVSLANHLTQLGFSREELVDANLCFISRNGNLIDRFANRVMFPIIDLRGNVVAFGGRIMTDEKPKYLNTSDTLVFKKSNNLFALNFAKRKTVDRIILAEGYMDVIALHQAGFIEAVATLGTALTSEQARMIKSYAKEVVVAYDSDAAGRKATSRAIDILRNAGLLVKILNIPQGKDPDEFLKSYKEEGPIRFKQLLEKSGNDIEYRLQKIEQMVNVDSADGKVAYLKGAVDLLSSIDDVLERDVYAGQVSEKVNVQKNLVVSQIVAKRKKNVRLNSKKEFRALQDMASGLHDKVNPQKNSNLRASCAEEALVAYIMHNQDMAMKIFEKLPPDKFLTDFNRLVYEYMYNRIREKKSLTMIDFGRDFKDDQMSRIVKIFLSGDLKSGDIGLANDYISVILQEYEKSRVTNGTPDDQILSYLHDLKKHKL